MAAPTLKTCLQTVWTQSSALAPSLACLPSHQTVTLSGSQLVNFCLVPYSVSLFFFAKLFEKLHNLFSSTWGHWGFKVLLDGNINTEYSRTRMGNWRSAGRIRPKVSFSTALDCFSVYVNTVSKQERSLVFNRSHINNSAVRSNVNIY